MEFADKGDLFQKITACRKCGAHFEEQDIWRVFIQMVKGLQALHELKILHRDLKSANIFLYSDGLAKLGDLNVSKVAKKGLGYTQTGTPYYASPEVWKDQPYDSKSDIWSLGCVTYEMASLKPPFRAENMEGLYNKVIKGKYPKLPSYYSGDLDEIIKLLLQVNAKDRPSCAQILRHPLVVKRLEFFKENSKVKDCLTSEAEESELLKTIMIPKNISSLRERLPGANYGSMENFANKAKTNMSLPNEDLPDIKFSRSKGVMRNKEEKENKTSNRGKCDTDKCSQNERSLNPKQRSKLIIGANQSHRGTNSLDDECTLPILTPKGEVSKNDKILPTHNIPLRKPQNKKYEININKYSPNTRELMKLYGPSDKKKPRRIGDDYYSNVYLSLNKNYVNSGSKGILNLPNPGRRNIYKKKLNPLNIKILK
ncbi:MAG: protein kinase [archaeon]|nr:protein kinase [archaeon]